MRFLSAAWGMAAQSVRGALAAMGVLFAAALVATAKDGGQWEVEGELAGKKGDDSENMSGIACSTDAGFPRTCIVIDDELQAAQVVILRDGTIAAGEPRMIPLIDDRHNGKPVELDGEGVAYADGHFYVIGSHGRPRRKMEEDPDREEARIAAAFTAASKLIRLKLDAASGAITPDPAGPSTALAKLIAEERLFDAHRDRELEMGGVTIEGVAVTGGRLFAGFRGPTVQAGDDAHAVIMSAALGHFFESQPAQVVWHRLSLGGGRGVRDLAAFDNGMLILAGPVTSNDGRYSVFWWDGAGDTAKRLSDLPDYRSKKGNQWKPESMLPLDRDEKSVRILLLLDGADEGKPREVRVPYP
jgi:hypothetical protein